MSFINNLNHFALPGDYRAITGRANKKASKRAIFLDIDGTLWPDNGPGTILQDPIITDEIISELEKISNFGYLLIGFTNQTYFGYQNTLNFFKILIYRSKVNLLTKKAFLDAIYICHHHPESRLFYLKAECTRRKPNSGLIEWAKEELNLDLDQSIVIGDRITDIAAGQESGIAKRILIANPRCLEWNVSSRTISPQSFTFSVFRSLFDALESIRKEIS